MASTGSFWGQLVTCMAVRERSKPHTPSRILLLEGRGGLRLPRDVWNEDGVSPGPERGAGCGQEG